MASRDRHWLLWALSLGLVFVVALPVAYLGYRAFELGSTTALRVLANSATWAALARTLILAVVVAVLCVALAVPLAWLTHCTDLPGRRWFRILLILPLAVPSYVGGFVVLLLFAPGGWLPVFEVYGAVGTVLAMLFTYPFALISLQAALARLDPRQWECARALGCTPVQAFWRVVLPQLRPAMGAGGLLIALYAVGDFGAVSLLRFESLSYLVYVRYKSLFLRDEAIYLSLLLLAVTSLLVLAFARAGGRTHRDLGGNTRVWPLVALGRWRWPSAALCALVSGLGVFVPVGVVVSWLGRGLLLGHDIGFPAGESLRSLALGAAAALVVVAVALFPTLLGRYATRSASSWIKLVSHLGYALPGIVVALALVSLTARWATPLYQTVTLLLIAYVVRFFPLAVHTLDDAVAAQSRGPYDAARSLGCSPATAWARVVLPTATSAIAAGLLAVFIAVIKELPATLLLSPADFATLATHIWSLTEDAYFSAAAPSVLILLLLAGIGLHGRPDIRRKPVL